MRRLLLIIGVVGLVGCKGAVPADGEFASEYDGANGADVAVTDGDGMADTVDIDVADAKAADGDAADASSLDAKDSADASDVSAADGDSADTAGCGNGICDGDETVLNCPADCSFLVKHLGGACTTPGSKDVCGKGFFCVARSAAGGDNICVADFSTWSPTPDLHPASDFTEAADYVTDKLSGLSWAKAPLAGIAWSTALTACNTAAYGGFNDWRLPTRAEMLSLTDRTKVQSACSAPNMTWTTPVAYWSSAPMVSGGATWYVEFESGSSNGAGTSEPYPVRCVRGGTTTGTGSGARFAVQDSGTTVLDRISGLHWQQGFSTTMSQPAALTWCSNNTPALPASGWRLPTSHELEDLVDTQTSFPSIDAIFGGTPSESFWSSNAMVNSTWFIDFGEGGSSVGGSSDRVRCVR